MAKLNLKRECMSVPMKFEVENLGKLKRAEFELGELTVVCGENNSGKSYLTNALFGFLVEWMQFHPMPKKYLRLAEIFEHGTVEIKLKDVLSKSQAYLDEFSERYSNTLPEVLGTRPSHLDGASFRCKVPIERITPAKDFTQTIGSSDSQLFSVTRTKTSSSIKVDWLGSPDALARMPRLLAEDLVRDIVRQLSFGATFARPLIASSERSGIVTFRKHLDFFRTGIIEKVSKGEKNIDPQQLIADIKSGFPKTIEYDVHFLRDLQEVSKHQSFFAKSQSIILDDFREIAGGSFGIENHDRLYFSPTKTRKRLSMRESSSSARALVNIAFHLHHVLQSSDLFLIDEPELGLHPKNQRLMAKLIASLVNSGVKVFVTTHSDYFIRELNTLMLLYNRKASTSDSSLIQTYRDDHRLNPEKVRVYSARKARIRYGDNKTAQLAQTLTPIPIDEERGLSLSTFDKQIDEMNLIQDEIIWGS